MNTLTTPNKLVDLDEFIDNQYGARGTAARETFEEGYEFFKLGQCSSKCARKTT